MAVNGTCMLAGNNDYGQLGDGNSGYGNSKAVPTAVDGSTVSSWISISAGYHTCGLAADSGQYGKAYCWGEARGLPAGASTPGATHPHGSNRVLRSRRL